MTDLRCPSRGAVVLAVVAGLLGPVLLAAAGGVLGVPPGVAHANEVHAATVRFEVADGGVLELDDGRRFVDTLELRVDDAGSTVLINDVTMDDYLSGVAEMPPRWHEEALRAQAVAARTYAWRSIERGTFADRGYDICATVDCQVFAGVDAVEERALGGRWRQAVLDTTGEVLLDEDDRPILARYFSTSGGRTLPNDLAFPSSGAFPYLVGVEDPDDEVAPLHRWRVEFTREEFEDVLSRGQTLSAAVPVAEVERRGDLLDPRAEVVVIGRDGTEVGVTAVRFREFVSRIAGDRHPDRFPSRRDDGRPMPTTLPSSRFEVEVADDRVVIEGRGWGHGVGMGQYGAVGKARRGMTYDEILASYYNGLTPEVDERVPERVRVGLSAADEVELRGDARMRILADGDEIAERTLGTWRVRAVDGRLRLRPPEGRDRQLEVSPTSLAPELAEEDDVVVAQAHVNKPAQLSLHVAREDGGTVLVRDLGVGEPGEHAATWRYADEDGERVTEGDYRLTIVAVDEQGVSEGRPLTVTVTEPASRAERRAGTNGRWGLVLLASVILVLATSVVTLALRRRGP